MKRIKFDNSGEPKGKWSIEAELTLWNPDTAQRESFNIELSEISQSEAMAELRGLTEILTKHFEGKS